MMTSFYRRSVRKPRDELSEYINLLSPAAPLINKACAVRGIRMQCRLPARADVDKLIKGLIHCLSIEYENVQRDAAWALTNYACYPHEICARIVHHGGITALAKCARSTDGETRDMAIWAIGNVAADCNYCRREVCWSSALPVLLNILNEGDFEYQHCASNLLWALSEIFRGGAPFLEPEVIFSIFASLYELMNTDNELFKKYATLCISYIAHDRFDGSQVDVMLSVQGLVERLVELFDDPATSSSALMAIGHVVAGNDIQAQRAIDTGVLSKLVKLYNTVALNARRKRIIGWILSNVAAGTEAQIDCLFDTKGITEVLQGLSLSDVRLIRSEACWAASNAFLRASQKRIVTLCIPYLPILAVALDDVREGALCENTVRALYELIQKHSNLLYMLHYVGILDQIQPIALACEDVELKAVATSMVESRDVMLAGRCTPWTFRFYD